MSTALQTGPIRIKYTESNAEVVLYLPPPDKKGLTIDFQRRAKTVELLDGSQSTRMLGYLPLIVAKWAIYSAADYGKYSIGATTGKSPELEDLLLALGKPGLSVSPGLSTNWILCDTVVVKPVGKLSGFYTGVEAAFYAKTVQATMAV
jgi:hypothetical protein